jgi:hypothetical protein
MLALVAAAGAAGATAGCGAKGAPPVPSPTAAAAPARSSSDVISAAEIRPGEHRDVYEAVQRLRPQFLRARGATSIRATSTEENLPVVFLDEQRLGGVSTMRGLPVENVHEIRFIAPRDATTRWGTGYTAGVILVVTRSR